MMRADRTASVVRPTLILCGILTLAAPVAAQGEDALRRTLEGKRVTVKIDMPGTAEGVDVAADSRQPIDYRDHGDRLKRYGTSIPAGASSTVTLVKVKKDLIEFQLSGGGFGTFADDTSTSVNMPLKEKTSREKDLEKRIKDETDSRRKRKLEDELDDLRDRRDRENRRIDVERVVAEERKKERIAAQRLRGGSRFNLRYEKAVPSGIRPEEVMAALAEYVDFSGGSFVPAETAIRPAVESPGEQPLPRKGMTRADAERAFGRPSDASDRREGSLAVTTLTFDAGDRRITAEFVEDVLVRYTIASR